MLLNEDEILEFEWMIALIRYVKIQRCLKKKIIYKNDSIKFVEDLEIGER